MSNPGLGLAPDPDVIGLDSVSNSRHDQGNLHNFLGMPKGMTIFS
jgi:hypothetical protein